MAYQDLSKNKNSATSVFMRVLPRIKEIREMTDLDAKGKLELAKEIVIKALIQAKTESPNAISKEYIDRYVNRLEECHHIDDVITKLRYSIQKGRNYARR